MQFRNHLSRRTINFQIHDSDYRQEVTGQANERKDPRDEENNRNDYTKHIRKEKQEKYNTRSINHNKRKADNQRRTNTKNGEIPNQTENENNGKPTMQILQRTKPNTQVPSIRIKL